MASSQIKNIDGVGEVKVTKKKGAKRITLRLHHSGQIIVNLPFYLPYGAGYTFAKSQKAWLDKQQAKTVPLKLYPEMSIGKGYTLYIADGPAIKSRITADTITISRPAALGNNDVKVTYEAKKAIKRALNKEAKQLFPERVEQLAKIYVYSYKTVRPKPMKSRWGSCSSNKTISLNCYLLMMPWPIIDYVIVHELAHTVHMNHSLKFWNKVAEGAPNYKELKKQLNKMQAEVHNLYV